MQVNEAEFVELLRRSDTRVRHYREIYTRIFSSVMVESLGKDNFGRIIFHNPDSAEKRALLAVVHLAKTDGVVVNDGQPPKGATPPSSIITN